MVDTGRQPGCASAVILLAVRMCVQAAFPTAHIAQRLEQTAAGLWPEQAPAVADEDAVPAALLKVCAASACHPACIPSGRAACTLTGAEGGGGCAGIVAGLHENSVSRLRCE